MPRRMKDGRAQVVGADRVAGRMGGPAIGRAVDKSPAHSRTGQYGRVTVRPVLTAAIGLVDPRRAAELANPDHERLVEQAAAVEVFQQGREALVGRRHQTILQMVEIFAVGVPEVLSVVVPVDRHQPDARFDQAAAQQEALTMNVPAVAIAQLRVLAIDLERPSRLGGDEAVERFLLVAVPRPRPVAGQVGGRGKTFQELATTSQPARRDHHRGDRAPPRGSR